MISSTKHVRNKTPKTMQEPGMAPDSELSDARAMRRTAVPVNGTDMQKPRMRRLPHRRRDNAEDVNSLLVRSRPQMMKTKKSRRRASRRAARRRRPAKMRIRRLSRRIKTPSGETRKRRKREEADANAEDEPVDEPASASAGVVPSEGDRK